MGKGEKEIENYLRDLDNLIETGHFPKVSVKEHTHLYQDLNLEQFIREGREIIRQSLVDLKRREDNKFTENWTDEQKARYQLYKEGLCKGESFKDIISKINKIKS